MFAVIAVGMPLTLLSTAQVAFQVRKYIQTEMLDAPTADALPPFGKMHFITWGMLSSSSRCKLLMALFCCQVHAMCRLHVGHYSSPCTPIFGGSLRPNALHPAQAGKGKSNSVDGANGEL